MRENTSPLKKLLSLFRLINVNWCIYIAFLMVIGMLLEIVGIGAIMPVVAIIVDENVVAHLAAFPALHARLEAIPQPTLVVYGLLLLVAVYVTKSIFLVYLVLQRSKFASLLAYEASKKLYRLYIHQPYLYHLNINSAVILRNLMTNVNVLVGTINAIMTLCIDCALLTGICILLFVAEPLASTVVVISLALAAAIFYRMTRFYIYKWGSERQLHEAQRIKQVQEGLGAIKEVKLLAKEQQFLQWFSQHSLQNAKIMKWVNTLKELPRLWLEVLAVAGMVFLIFFMMLQEKQMSSIIPTLGLFAAAIFRLIPCMNRLLSNIQIIRHDIPVIEIFHQDLQLPLPVESTCSAPFPEGNISINAVSFHYGNDHAASLQRISLVIKKGTTVGIVGESGAGKSTLIDILLGLLPPTSGCITVNRENILDNLRAWQAQIGYVPQEIYLTDDTLAKNIAFGVAESAIDRKKLKQALASAQLEEFIASLPHGVDTLVGERGARLSGGQRQRVGIARALYNDPKILVLDEATSSLDTATEQNVMRAINAMHGKKTIVIVAHRMSTVEQADTIYRLQQGRLVAAGTDVDQLQALCAQ